MKQLQELQFIDLKAGKAGPMTYALIYNPHLALQWHYQKKTPGLTEASYSALIERALDVGAMDMFPAPSAPPPPLPVPPSVPTPADAFGVMPPVSPVAPPTTAEPTAPPAETGGA